MITLRHRISLMPVAAALLLAVACSSASSRPAPSATIGQLLVGRADAIEIALTASQDRYDNLRSLGMISVTAFAGHQPISDPDDIPGIFRDRVNFPGAGGVWLVEVRLTLIGTPDGSGTSYAAYAVDESTGRLVAQLTYETSLLNGSNAP